MPGKYYVYVHRKQTDGSIFYVGKGTGNRAYAIASRSAYWHRVFRKHGRVVQIVASGLSEQCAFSLERAMIAYIGTGRLCNMTLGGEGTSGRVPSLSQRQKCSKSNKGNRPSDTSIEAAIIKNSKPVGTVCGLRFPSAREAARRLFPDKPERTSVVSISSACRGICDRAYGYQFRFVDEAGDLVPSGYTKAEVGRPVKTECGMSFHSATAATKWLKANGHPKAINSNIIQCCKRRVASAYGFRWSYA